MKQIAFQTMTIAALLSLAGCGASPTPPAAATTTTSSPDAEVAEAPAAEAPGATASESPAKAATVQAKPAPEARPEPAQSEKTEAAGAEKKVAEAKPAAPPATAKELLQAIDLRKLPRINEIRILDEGPTHVHYSAKTTIAGADAFYSAELKSRGWTPAPGIPAVSDQYADRLFEKDGFYVRLSMGAGADEGIAGISMYNLGNVDLRSIPRIKNVEPHAASTPVNVSYQTDASMADATKFCREQMAKLGWREFGPMHDPGIDVPHVKQMTFFQNAVRLDAMVAKQIDKPAAPATVAYMAQHAMPFDLPIAQDATAVKLDHFSGRAEYLTPTMPKDVFNFYQAAGQQLGWKPQPKGTHSDDDSASMIVEDQPEQGFGIAIGRRDNQTTVSLTRLSLKEPVAEEPAVPEVAATQPEIPEPAVPTPEIDAIDKVAEDILKDVQKSLKGDLGDLQKELKKLGNIKLPVEIDDDEPKETKQAEVNEPEPSAEDVNLPKLETLGTFEFDGKKHSLKHAVAYVEKNEDEATPVVILSGKAADKGKLTRTLSAGKDVWISDLFGFDSPAAVQIRLGEHQTSISAFVEGASINVSSSDKFETDFKLIGKRLRGTVKQKEPDDFFDKAYTISASFDLETVQGESAATGSDAELVADSNYDLPVPEGTTSLSKEGSKYRQTLNAEIDSPVAKVSEFYRRELQKRGWKETGKPAAKAKTGGWKGSFTGPEGNLALELTGSEESTSIRMNISNSAAAKRDGLLPKSGMALLALGNMAEEAVVFTVNGKEYKLAAGAGREDPSGSTKIEVKPGKHVVKVRLGNGQTLSEEVQADANTTWAALALPAEGVLAMQVY